MSEVSDRDQFEEWLPWYLNGTLGSTERLWVEDYMRTHPQYAGNLNVEQAIRSVLREQVVEQEVDDGLDAFMDRVRASPSTASQQRLGWRDRLANWQTAWRLSHVTPAMALMSTLLVLQSGLLAYSFMRSSNPPYSEWRAPTELNKTVSGKVLQINFQPEATEEKIRLLLVRIDGRLVGGPGQLGNYLVTVPVDKLESSRELLGKERIVQAVKVLDSVPADD